MQTTNAREDVCGERALYTVDGNINTAATVENTGAVPKNRPDVPAVPFLSTYPKEAPMARNGDTSCVAMVTTAPSTIDESWDRPKCPSTGKWIKKLAYGAKEIS